MTTLADYEVSVQNLIQAPSSPLPLIPLAAIDSAINTARGQIALEAECVREYATLAVDGTSFSYPFTSIALPPTAVGVQQVINIRMATYSVGVAGGALRINAREWEWFNNYVLGKATTIPSSPKYWAQFGQGSAGTFFINKLDTTYTLNLDTVCYPLPLTTGSTELVIPYGWTDAIPYYAAWQIFMSLQRQADAEAMMKRYKEFVARARQGATPSVLPHQYEQVPDPTLPAKIGIRSSQGDGNAPI